MSEQELVEKMAEAFVFEVEGDKSDADYLGVSKTLTATGAIYHVQGPLAKAIARALMEERDATRNAALDALATEWERLDVR